MFVRRHPYLFFFLLLAAMATIGIIMLTVIVTRLDRGQGRYTGEKVGIIEIVGVLTDSRPILQQIKVFRESKAIKAIVIRIESPGGSVGPAQEIYREIRKTVAHKKVIVSMGAVAASGGYYVAAAADGIVANPGTITGSIGVVMGYTNFAEVMRKIGLTPVIIKSGEFKDLGSPTRPMTDKEKELLVALTDQIHRQFITAIVEGRKLPRQDVEAVADGRIITGEAAQKLGLVDRLGNFEDAVQWAAKLGGVTGEIETVYPQKEKPPLLRYLIESAMNTVFQGRAQTTLAPEVRLPSAFAGR
jgi:protease IV